MERDSRGSVLVVEDEPTIAEVVSRYLGRAGYRTRTAADGPRALELAESEQPDLVVLDLMLPRMDGLEVMRRLRDQGRDRLPVILLTAKGEESGRVIGLRLGATWWRRPRTTRARRSPRSACWPRRSPIAWSTATCGASMCAGCGLTSMLSAV